MNNTILRIATVSITALSLSACMSGQGSPWSPEFGQTQASPHQQATYGQSQYQYGQYPMPSVQPQAQPHAHAHMAGGAPGNANSQHLSPLPNTYQPQPTARSSQQARTYGGYGAQTQPHATHSPSSSSYMSSPARSAYPQQTQPTGQPSASPYAAATPTSVYQAPTQMPQQYGHQAAMTPHMSQAQPMAPNPYYQQQPVNMMNDYETPYVQSLPSSGGQSSYMMQAQNHNMMTPATPAQPQPMQHSMAQTMPMQQSMAPARQVTGVSASGIPWGQAMAWMYQGHVKSASQTHNGDVKLTLHNGQTVDTKSPRVDDVMRVKQDCGAVCANMMIATE